VPWRARSWLPACPIRIAEAAGIFDQLGNQLARRPGGMAGVLREWGAGTGPLLPGDTDESHESPYTEHF
jgi:hypothetical protein